MCPLVQGANLNGTYNVRTLYVHCTSSACWVEDEVDDVVLLAVRQVSWQNRSFIRNCCGSSVSNHADGSSDEWRTWSPGKYATEELRDKQLNDPDIRSLIQWLEDSCDPSQREQHLCSTATKFFWNVSSLLEMHQGILYYKWLVDHAVRFLMVVPTSLRKDVPLCCHDLKTAGHPGISRTYLKLQQSAIWYGMKVDCVAYVKSCKKCNRPKKASLKARAELGSFHAEAPLERIHIDILGPFNSSFSGNMYVLMLVCQLTKWVEAYALSDQTSESVLHEVVNNIISRFGCPAQVHTDQGSNFTSSLFKAVCELLQFTKTQTTPYRPCSNRQVEQYNRTLLQISQCYLDEDVSM